MSTKAFLNSRFLAAKDRASKVIASAVRDAGTLGPLQPRGAALARSQPRAIFETSPCRNIGFDEAEKGPIKFVFEGHQFINENGDSNFSELALVKKDSLGAVAKINAQNLELADDKIVAFFNLKGRSPGVYQIRYKDNKERIRLPSIEIVLEEDDGNREEEEEEQEAEIEKLKIDFRKANDKLDRILDVIAGFKTLRRDVDRLKQQQLNAKKGRGNNARHQSHLGTKNDRKSS